MSSQNENAFTCKICNMSEINNLDYGETLSQDNVSVHYFCMLFSTNLPQRGEDNEGIKGFLLHDIKKLVQKYGKKLKCCYCGNDHATLHCAEKNCKKIFHLICGMKNDCNLQFVNQYSPYCKDHTKMVPVPVVLPQYEKCFVCSERMGDSYDLSTWIPSCTKCNLGFSHRKCIKMTAIMSGYYFKCILCENESTYREDVKLMGIYVPDTEASWERPSYYENLNYYRYCEADVCKCELDKYHNASNGKWKLDICKFCGYVGMHNGCKIDNKKGYTCKACQTNIESINGNIYSCGFSFQQSNDQSMITNERDEEGIDTSMANDNEENIESIITDQNINELRIIGDSDEPQILENDVEIITIEDSDEPNIVKNHQNDEENMDTLNTNDNENTVKMNESFITNQNVNQSRIIDESIESKIVENDTEIVSISSKSDQIDAITILTESISEGPEVLVNFGKYKVEKFKYESARLQRYKDEVLDGPAYTLDEEMPYGCYCSNCADLNIYDQNQASG